MLLKTTCAPLPKHVCLRLKMLWLLNWRLAGGFFYSSGCFLCSPSCQIFAVFVRILIKKTSAVISLTSFFFRGGPAAHLTAFSSKGKLKAVNFPLRVLKQGRTLLSFNVNVAVWILWLSVAPFTRCKWNCTTQNDSVVPANGGAAGVRTSRRDCGGCLRCWVHFSREVKILILQPKPN